MTIKLPRLTLVVAVSQRIDFIADRGEIRDSIDQRLINWLVSSGYFPVCIPNGLYGAVGIDQTESSGMLERWLFEVAPNALLLSGGNDIGQFPQRDATEKHLLSWAEINKVPVLGICRGMQMMAVWAGETLSKVEGHVKTRHRLIMAGHEFSLPCEVNSYHDWAVPVCPSGFVRMAFAEDGVIEAIKHQTLPWEGWMWHPEREVEINSIDTKRMQALFNGKEPKY